MTEQGRYGSCVVSTMSLCVLELKQSLINLLFQIKALQISIEILKSSLGLICEYELHTIPNTKVRTAKEHGESQLLHNPLLVG